jgi:uncharacterized protein YjbI with pentapeptide repeats
MTHPRSFSELLERYRRGERDFADAELDGGSDNDLSGVCLDGADFSRAFLVAKFQGASLRGVRFCGANLKTCDFRNADLRGADFSGTALCATAFTSANIDGATFAGAFFHSRVLAANERPDW